MKTFATLLLFSTVHLFSQNLEQTAVGISYRYIDRNVLQLSIEQVIQNSQKHKVVLGASILYTSVDGQAKYLPEIHSYYTRELGLVGLSVNTYAIEPRLGFSFFNGIYLTSGYAFPIDQNKYFKGLTFGIQFNIGVSKHSKFYDDLKLF